MTTKRLAIFLSLCLAVIGLTSCVKNVVLAVEVTQAITQAPPIIAVPTSATPTSQSTPVSTSIPTPFILPPEPQSITFKTSDGIELQGYYYPAATNPAPLVVMMHWAGDDMSTWYELAVWLQNRGQVNPFPNSGDMPWLDPSWFPDISADKSYGVVIFTFRGCKPYASGCLSFNTAGWLDDAQSVMAAARELEGVDPGRIVAIGASIGGDGAVDGCLHLNNLYPGTCRGALSLSPGNYLNLKYDEVIEELGLVDPPVTVWCLAASFEFAICEQAEGRGNIAYTAYEIPYGEHGTFLLKPNLEPNSMQLVLDFLDQVLN